MNCHEEKWNSSNIFIMENSRLTRAHSTIVWISRSNDKVIRAGILLTKTILDLLNPLIKTFIHFANKYFNFWDLIFFATIVSWHNSAPIYLETLLIFIIDDLCESRLLLSKLSYNCRIPPCWNYSTILKTNVNRTTYFNIYIN